ncbi:MAG: ribonuclease Z [Bacteroidia bacterium]
MPFEILILGNSSATPTLDRFPSGQIIRLQENYFMVDAGEGMQVQLLRYGVRASRISHVFISHLHPDHYLGLIGWICTQNLQRRSSALTIYGPAGLEEIVMVNMRHSGLKMQYELIFEELEIEQPKVILDLPECTVETVPLLHRIPTAGFIFREKPHSFKINQEAFAKENLPVQAYSYFRRGEDFQDDDGKRYSFREFTYPPPPPRTYACLSDTRCSDKYFSQIAGADLLYHEATFRNQHLDLAEKTLHSTTGEAAMAARQTNAKQLIISHFSSRYKNLEELLKEARAVFPNTELARAGLRLSIPFQSA